MTPTDWPALIQRLERYYRHLDIGIEVGRSERWVGMLKSGDIDEPPHSVGEALKAMDRDLALQLAVQAVSSVPLSIRVDCYT